MFKILQNQKIMYMPLWFAPNCRNYKCRFMKTLKDICIKILSFIIYNHPSINSITSWPHQNTVICGKNIILDNYFSWKKKITMEVKLFLKIRTDKLKVPYFWKKCFYICIAFKFEFWHGVWHIIACVVFDNVNYHKIRT